MTLVNDVEENCYDISFCFLLYRKWFFPLFYYSYAYSYSDFEFDSFLYRFRIGRLGFLFFSFFFIHFTMDYIYISIHLFIYNVEACVGSDSVAILC